MIGEAGINGRIQIFNSSTVLTNSIQAHTDSVNRIKLLLNGFVATISHDTTAKIWCASSFNLNLIRTYTSHTSAVMGLESLNTNTIATGSYDKTIHIWSITTGITQMIINTTLGVNSLQMLRDGIQLAAGLLDGRIQIFNLNNGNLLSTLQEHLAQINDIVLVNNGELLVSSSSDLSLKIWNLTTNKSIFTLNGHSSNVIGLKQVSLDIVASASNDATIKLWNITNGKLIGTLAMHTNFVHRSIDLFNDNNNVQRLISGSFDQTIKLWDYETRQCLKTINVSMAVRSLLVLNLTAVSSKKINYFIDRWR